MKVSLLQHAYARYLSQESRFTNYPLWRPFSKSFQKRRGRRAKAEEKSAFFEFMRGKCTQGLGENCSRVGENRPTAASSLNFFKTRTISLVS